jgi:hypothetical protein
MVINRSFYLIFCIIYLCFAEIAYPEDEIIVQEVPTDITPAVVESEVEIISSIGVPQIDRTRKPINNQKPELPPIEKLESPTIEKQELPVKPIEDEQSTIVIKEQPQIPDRSIKPIIPIELVNLRLFSSILCSNLDHLHR